MEQAGSEAASLAVQAEGLDTALSGLEAPLTLLSRHPQRSGLPDLDAARDDVVRTATTELSGLKGQVAGLRQLAASAAAGGSAVLAAASALAEEVSGRIADLGATLGAAFSASTDEAVQAVVAKALADAERALALADFAGAAARTAALDTSTLAEMTQAVVDARTALAGTDPDHATHEERLAAERELVRLFDAMLGASLDILAHFERGGPSTNGRIIEAAVDQVLGLSRSAAEEGLFAGAFAAPASSAGIALMRDVMLDWYPPRLRVDGGVDDFSDRAIAAGTGNPSFTNAFVSSLGQGALSRLFYQSTGFLPLVGVLPGLRDEARPQDEQARINALSARRKTDHILSHNPA